MTTTADLDRLQALLSRLTPVASRQRGEVIRADDWNLVVGSLIELARAVLAEAASPTVPAHDHTDQVQLSWLDGRLRGILQTGPLGDPAAITRLSAVERRLSGSGGNLDEVKAEIDALRDRVGQVTTRDLVRESDVTLVRRSMAAIGDTRGDVLSLRETLAAIRTDLTRAIEVGRELEVDGRRVDIPGLVGTVAELQNLREHLTFPDGRPLDAAELERRLTELTNTLVTEEELDAALEEVRGPIPADVLEGVKGDVLRSTLAQVNPKIDDLRAETSGTIDDRLSDLDGRIGGAVDDRLPQVRDEILSAAQSLVDSAILDEDAAVRTLLEQRLTATSAGLRTELGERVDSVEDTIAPTSRTEASKLLDQRLPPIIAAVAGLTGRTGELESDVTGLASHNGTQDAAIGKHTADLAALSGRVDREIPAAIATADVNAQARVTEAGGKLRNELTAFCDQRIGESLSDVLTQLRGEVREIVRDEIEPVREELRKYTDERIRDRFEQLPEDVLDIFKADFARQGPLYQLIVERKGIAPKAAAESAGDGGEPEPTARPAARKATTKRSAAKKSARRKGSGGENT
ncbi:hypothetical protein AB0I28_02275 [Phytomonospora sp. NPDC050363]|uniref:hypothetical protein n=1 Tax=Phytomonospora sp. NPDC050363 TaxID=3155642 RepID=UPI0034105FC4